MRQAILAHGGGHLSGDGICDILEWSPGRYDQARQDVAYRLDGGGLRFELTGGDSYGIVSRLHPYDEPLGTAQWLERTITSRAGLTPTEVQQLYRLTPSTDSGRIRLAGDPNSTTLPTATSHTSARDRRSPSGDKPLGWCLFDTLHLRRLRR